jgi:UDPglucose 6-dehydrogenase
VAGYDPVAMPNAGKAVPNLHLAEDPYELAEMSDALLVCTEWNEFKQLDLGRIRDLMKKPVVVDGRNIYDPAKMYELGFRYRAVGRSYNPESNGSNGVNGTNGNYE